LEIAFGKVIGSLKKDVSFSKAFDTTTIASDYRFRYPWYRVGPAGASGSSTLRPLRMVCIPLIPRFCYRFVQWTPWSQMERKLRASVRDLDAFAQEVIDERRQKSLDEGTDLLSRCLNTTDDHGLPFSDKFLRDIIMNFMYA
jgi:hypothetical protein